MKTYQGHQNSKFSLSGAFGTYGGEAVKQVENAFVASGSEDGRLLWWEVVSKDVLGEAHGHDGVVLGVDTRKDGLIVSCGIDKTIRIWEKVRIEDGGRDEGMNGLMEGGQTENMPTNGENDVEMTNGDHSPGSGIKTEKMDEDIKAEEM